ncbi:MAG: glycosyltransferase [Alistipes ihumii]
MLVLRHRTRRELGSSIYCILKDKIMLLSIVILNFNTAPLTIQCIRSIKRHCTIPASDYEIIIVDNHSREEDVEKLTRECQGIPDSQSAHLPGSDALTTAAATPPRIFYSLSAN